METRILTIMFTDLKGFTEKTSTQSREELNFHLDMQDDLVRPIIDEYKGVVVKTIGDAFMVTFESPTNAVMCGVKIQEAISDHNITADEGHKLNMRLGINSGEVNIKNNDVFGEPVNIASRIEGIAEPGEIYFTDAVYLAMNKNEIPSSEVGKRHLKGIAEMITVYKVLKDKGALDAHIAKRKAAAQVTGMMSKTGIVGAVKFTKKSLFIKIGIVLFVVLLAGLGLFYFSGNRILKKTDQNKVAPNITLPKEYLESLSPREQQQVNELLKTPITDMTTLQKQRLKKIEERINQR